MSEFPKTIFIVVSETPLPIVRTSKVSTTSLFKVSILFSSRSFISFRIVLYDRSLFSKDVLMGLKGIPSLG